MLNGTNVGLPKRGGVAFPGDTAFETNLQLNEILRALWRNKWPVILTAFFIAFFSYFALLAVTPKYTASTVVFIENAERNVANIEAVITDSIQDEEGMANEIEIISSRKIAGNVISQLGLDQDPEFNSALRPRAIVDRILDLKTSLVNLVSTILRDSSSTVEAGEQSPEEKRQTEFESTIDAFLEDLGVSVRGKSRAISVNFTSENPAKAARIANAVAEAYVLDQLEYKYEATVRANQWLTAKISDVRGRVEQAENAIETYRKETGLLEGTGGPLLEQQISELNSQLIVAKMTEAEASTRLAQVLRLIRQSGGAGAAAEVLASPVVQDLLVQEAQVKRKVAELSNEYGNRHPRMINARAELRDLQSKISGEIRKIVEQLKSEVNIARARTASLQRSLENLKGELSQSNSASIKLRALERDADAERTILETFLSRLKETSAQVDTALNESNARVLSKAFPPQEPSYPRKSIVVLLVFVGCIMVGLFYIILKEQLDIGFKSGDQIERMIGVRVLGHIPIVKGLKRKQNSPSSTSRTTDFSIFTEALRSIYTRVLLTDREASPKSLLITSSLPGEGKTTLSLSLARALSRAGKKVISIEVDVRRPCYSRILRLPRAPGLVDYLTEKAELPEVLVKDPGSDCVILPAGSSVSEPTAILTSRRMKMLLEELKSEFDAIVIDSPPVMAASDALLLAPKADTVLFLVKWAQTNRKIVNESIRRIAEVDGDVGGVILTMVDPAKQEKYDFGDSGYYHSAVRKYYKV